MYTYIGRKWSKGAKKSASVRTYAPTQRHCTAGQGQQHGQGLNNFQPHTHHPPCAGALELAWGAVLPAGGAGYGPGMERVAFRPKG